MNRRIILASIFFALITTNVFGNPVSLDRFGQANQLYREGKYLEAVNVYEDLIKEKPLAEVYYNLGNAYFKAGKLGLAILNYERARSLKPRDPDILANSSYLTRSIEYKIEDKRNWYQRKISEVLAYVTFEECMFLCFAAYFLFILGLLFSLIFKKQPLFGRMGILALAFIITCSIPLFLKFAESGAGRRSIVTEPQAEVRYGPSTSDRIAFRLAEGLEITLDDEKEDWYRIRLRDGRSGWTAKSQVSPI